MGGGVSRRRLGMWRGVGDSFFFDFFFGSGSVVGLLLHEDVALQRAHGLQRSTMFRTTLSLRFPF